MDIDFYRHYAQAAQAARGPAWRYDEMKPCGFNYNNFLLARVYDTYHQMFRDYRRETEQIVARLECEPFATVIDMGCGTGAFAIHAAPCYHRIHAVDVSRAMLRRARRKARRAGLSNVEFHHGGYLTYEHQGPPADAAVSVAALHHLPDFWKLVGLHRLASMLKPSGRFYLFDVVFSFDVAQCESAANQFIQRMSVHLGPNGRTESETHLRSEYSTCSWIIEGLLERAGFQIDEADYKDDFLAAYVCTKKAETARARSLTVAGQQLR
jgi:putative AdoMet-dependent methyltransferase